VKKYNEEKYKKKRNRKEQRNGKNEQKRRNEDNEMSPVGIRFVVTFCRFDYTV